MQVEVLAVDGCLVDLEVARVDDHADRRRDCERHAVGHAVRDADEFDAERPDCHAVPWLDDVEAIPCVASVLVELGLNERQRHGRAVHGTIEL